MPALSGARLQRRPGASPMTQDRLATAIRQGLGQGREAHYLPWIRVRRKLSSPVNNIYSVPVPLHERSLQLLSGQEFRAAAVALWLGCREIREQHPAWPHEHDHPATGLDPQLDARYERVSGLAELARKAGIEHGTYPGTDIPFVATIDFTLTVGGRREQRLVHWSCPDQHIADRTKKRVARMEQRLALERLYSQEVGAKHVVIQHTTFSRVLTANLDWLQPLRSELNGGLCQQRLKDFGARFMEIADSYTVSEAKARLAAQMKLDAEQRDAYFRGAAWLGAINVDMSQPIVMQLPLRQDITGIKARLRDELFGGDA